MHRTSPPCLQVSKAVHHMHCPPPRRRPSSRRSWWGPTSTTASTAAASATRPGAHARRGCMRRGRGAFHLLRPPLSAHTCTSRASLLCACCDLSHLPTRTHATHHTRRQLHLAQLPPYLCASLQRFVFDPATPPPPTPRTKMNAPQAAPPRAAPALPLCLAAALCVRPENLRQKEGAMLCMHTCL